MSGSGIPHLRLARKSISTANVFSGNGQEEPSVRGEGNVHDFAGMFHWLASRPSVGHVPKPRF